METICKMLGIKKTEKTEEIDEDGLINQIRQIIQTDKEKCSLMQKQWLKIGDFEYKISPAFGGERCNVLWRKPGVESSIYNILFAWDTSDFIM
jgi:hypothetical protein